MQEILSNTVLGELQSYWKQSFLCYGYFSVPAFPVWTAAYENVIE